MDELKVLEEKYGVKREEIESYIEFVKSLDIQKKSGLKLLFEGLKIIKRSIKKRRINRRFYPGKTQRGSRHYLKAWSMHYVHLLAKRRMP